MTCIIGIEHPDGARLFADSTGAAGWNTMPRRDGKLAQIHDGMALGFTSSYRMGQLLAFGLTEWASTLRTPPGSSWSRRHRWMVRTFVPEVRRILDEGGYLKSDLGRVEGGTFIVALGRHVFVVEDDLQVSSPEDGYWAVGCGAHYALGAMHAVHESVQDSSETLDAMGYAGIRAAMRFSNGVDGRIDVMSVQEHAR